MVNTTIISIPGSPHESEIDQRRVRKSHPILFKILTFSYHSISTQVQVGSMQSVQPGRVA